MALQTGRELRTVEELGLRGALLRLVVLGLVVFAWQMSEFLVRSLRRDANLTSMYEAADNLVKVLR